LISSITEQDAVFPWRSSEFDYKEDKTQWVKDAQPIQISYTFCLSKGEDPSLISFIDRFAPNIITSDRTFLELSNVIGTDDEIETNMTINGNTIEEKSAKEIERKIRNSNALFLHNSTTQIEEVYFSRGRRRMLYDFAMSLNDKKSLDTASKSLERQLRKLAKDHTKGLTEVLGQLSEKYEIELSPPDSFTSRRMPLVINLRDKNVEVPLMDWGSGTQNRTHILMTILRANRIKTTALDDEKITPFVVIEEPESFLHPSAQAEFGKLLRRLSSEFGIQIIVTTHSPYMLNQKEPAANILLNRNVKRNKLFETVVVPTTGEEWMAPFADHLGVGADEFRDLRPMFSTDQSRVLLVEGPIDQEYFELLKQTGLERV